MIFFQILITFTCYWTLLYLISKILNTKIVYRTYKFWCFFVVFGIISILCQYYTNSFFLLRIGMIWIISKILWKKDIHQTGLAVLFSFFTTILSEILVVTILRLCFPASWHLSNFLYVALNLLISLFSIFLFYLLSLERIFQRSLEYFQEEKWKLIVPIGILIVSIIQFYFANTTFFVWNLLFILSFCIIFIAYIKEKIESNKIADDYQRLISEMETFEDMLSKQVQQNKEYQYQLSFLRQMLKEQGKEDLSYVDDLLNKETLSFNGYLLTQIQKLSKRTLIGLFYYKISVLQEKQIQI